MKTAPAWLFALGRRELPQEMVVGGATYRRIRVLKNDFFAATAFYEGTPGRVILKVGRQAPLLGIPMRWVGRILAAKEHAVLEQLSGLAGIPRYLGRWEDTGFVRQYIDGHALSKGERVADDFFPRLRNLIQSLHDRDLAYVDLEKCENVLVGTDGGPYLFDFQISWYLPRRWGGNLVPARMLRERFQAADRYHLLKLQRRTRPDQLPPEVLAASYRKPWYVRVQGVISRPFTRLRRMILRKLNPRGHKGERGWMADDSTMEMT